ncbi:MAG: flagellar motor protein MotB [Acetatifactor sp.]
MAKKKEDTPPAGSPAWMATFSDLMNLLLCFFVMLFSMSTIQEDKLAAFVAAMNSTFSIFDGGATAIGDGLLISNGVSQLNELDKYINSTGRPADSTTDGENLEQFDLSQLPQEVLEEVLKEEQLKNNEELSEGIEEALTENMIGDDIDVSFTSQYIQLSMSGALLFDSGSAQLKEESKEILLKVGTILEQYEGGIIEIEGHTDNVPIYSAQFADNEELSSARALTVFYFLKENTLLDPVNMKHAGMGERVPVADNGTAEGRSRNRRVEIKIFNPSRG